ncbi:ferrous iron transport protein B, partial [bacterium]|nr:ferrous iron transport protein B [bacterium]
SSRYYAIKLLEKDKAARFSLSRWDNYPQIEQISDMEISRLENVLKEDPETLITDSRYGFISGALKETFVRNTELRRKNSEVVDAFLTHKIFGFPILFLIMFITFYFTFEIGKYPMHWLEQLISLLSVQMISLLPPGPLTDLIVDGILGGVGSVIVFLPNILIIFYFISLMEDTGYMARAAFIMDKVMHKIGLHGRSFIPLIMGFGCNVPAIMATRTIKNRNNRLVTMLINPFMSCSARLPVYILIIGAFFPDNAGVVLFSIYVLGIIVASLIAILFKKILFKTEEVPFVMELPPYRVPTLRTTFNHMWNKGVQYLKKMGGIILVASILIWGLSYYPRENILNLNPVPEKNSSEFMAHPT